MGLKSEINNEINVLFDKQAKVKDVGCVPDLTDRSLTFGITGIRFDCICFYIDMRGSTKLLEKYNSNVIIKIHKVYFITILRIVNSLGGEVRSFNGDSILAFFLGNDKNAMKKAISAAMQIKHMVLIDENSLKNKIIQKYNVEIDIGIGLDYGSTVASKVGHSEINNQDLIWIGSNVNRSVKISDGRNNPYNIGITKRLYDNLPSESIYSNGRNMWQQTKFRYNDNEETIYITQYYIEVKK